MKHRTDEEYKKLDMKTELQWAKLNKLPNDNVSGIALWCNPWHQNWSVYYNADEVHEADGEELEKFFQPYKEREKKRRKRTKEKQQRLWEKELENSYKRGEEEAREYYEKEIFKMKKNLKENFYDIFMKQEQMKDNISKCQGDGVICFDVETTGLNPEVDEILQVSVINGKGDEMINTYVKPYYTLEWKEAEQTNGITKDMINNAPYAHELMDALKEIFSEANTWIVYNGQFDLNFLKYLGIEADESINLIDVMYDFAPLYGEWSNKYECYKWQKLSTCARFFGYEFKAHDSMEDVKATLHCYNVMKKMMDDGSYEKIMENRYVEQTGEYYGN